MAKGKKTGGRQAGTANRQTTALKDAIQMAFEGIGGVRALTAWAKANPDLFYTKVAIKLLPHDVRLQGSVTVDDKRKVMARIPDALLDQLAEECPDDAQVH